MASVDAGPDGAFVLEVPAGTVGRLGLVAGTDRAASRVRTSDLEGRYDPVDLLLRAWSTTTVRVRGAGGAPVAGARVSLVAELCYPSVGTTDARGEVTLLAVRMRQEWEVVVEAPGHATERRARKDELTVDLAPEVRLEGRLLDAQGRPAAGELVAAFADVGYLEPSLVRAALLDPGLVPGAAPFHVRRLVVALATTDEEGRFTLGNLAEGREVVVGSASRDPSIPPLALAVVPSPGERLERRQAQRSPVLVVRFTRDGAPLAAGDFDGSVGLQRQTHDGRFERAWGAASVVDGAHRVEGLALGLYRVVVGDSDELGTAPTWTPGVELGPTLVQEVVVALGAGRTVRGRVVDRAGAPAGDALLRYEVGGSSWGISAGDASEFVFDRAPEGEFSIQVHLRDTLTIVPVPAGLTRVADVIVDVGPPSPPSPPDPDAPRTRVTGG